jgi:hypothetical protein
MVGLTAYDCAGQELTRVIAGHVAFFGFISEMKVPTDYPKTLYMLQFTDTVMYLVAAVVIYRYGGTGVASPALGSTGPLMSKIAYGIAIPTVRDSLDFVSRHLLINPDRHRRCHQRPRRLQIHLRPALPWHGPHAQAYYAVDGRVDSDCSGLVGYCMGHR